jgi:hypothetical protein
MKRVMVLALLAVAACGGATEPTQINVVGSYQLKSVAGVALPAPVSPPAGYNTATVTAGTLTLNADGTWSTTATFRLVATNATTTTQAAAIGIYSAVNGAVSFTTTTGITGNFSGNVNGNTLTVLQGPTATIYQR